MNIGSANTAARDQISSKTSEPSSLDYSNHSSLDTISNLSSAANSTTSNNKRTRDLALCAVILDEWLKELAAISQEQSIVMLTDTFINHF